MERLFRESRLNIEAGMPLRIRMACGILVVHEFAGEPPRPHPSVHGAVFERRSANRIYLVRLADAASTGGFGFGNHHGVDVGAGVAMGVQVSLGAVGG